jgi:hypothetical protein
MPDEKKGNDCDTGEESPASMPGSDIGDGRDDG